MLERLAYLHAYLLTYLTTYLPTYIGLSARSGVPKSERGTPMSVGCVLKDS